MERWFREYRDCVKNLEADITLNSENFEIEEATKKLDPFFSGNKNKILKSA